ncbi:MAG: phosphotransferase [Pseudomonadota bacterium]
MSRTNDLNAFIDRAGWNGAARMVVAGDASNRRYERLTLGAETSIVMDAPPSKGEDVRPFIRIAGHLKTCGLSAPSILAADEVEGFLLLEDLGDDIYARVLERDATLEGRLYSAAVNVLVELHQHPAPALEPYDAATMTALSMLAFDWYLAGVDSVDTSARQRAETAIYAILEPILPSVMIQRDYHAENLLWLPERHGVARVGLLDFQDAMLGHPAYDMCSILLDARRDVPRDIHDAMLEHYIVTARVGDETAFRGAYWALALQRNLRIIGVFARLCLRDGKPHYVDLLPRVWSHVERALEEIGDAVLKKAVGGALPEPTSEIRERIKAQCATRQTP